MTNLHENRNDDDNDESSYDSSDDDSTDSDYDENAPYIPETEEDRKSNFEKNVKVMLSEVTNEQASEIRRRMLFENICSVSNSENYIPYFLSDEYNLLKIYCDFLDNPPYSYFISLTISSLHLLSSIKIAAVQICKPSNGILSRLFHLLHQHSRESEKILRCFDNLSIHRELHSILFSEEYDIINVCYSIMTEENNSFVIDAFRTIELFAFSVEKENRNQFLRFPLIQKAFHLLLLQGHDLIINGSRYHCVYYWCFNYLMTISAWRNLHSIIIPIIQEECPGFFPYFLHFLHENKEIEGIKALIILSNLSFSPLSIVDHEGEEKYSMKQEFHEKDRMLVISDEEFQQNQKEIEGYDKRKKYSYNSFTRKLIDLFAVLSGQDHRNINNINYDERIFSVRDLTTSLSSLTKYQENRKCISCDEGNGLEKKLIDCLCCTLSTLMKGEVQSYSFRPGRVVDDDVFENVLKIVENLHIDGNPNEHKEQWKNFFGLLEKIVELHNLPLSIDGQIVERGVGISTDLIMVSNQLVTRYRESLH